EEFHWIDGHRFWYVNNSKEGRQYLLVDSRARKEEQLFDHVRLAENLSDLLGTQVKNKDIEIEKLSFTEDGNRLLFSNDSLNMSLNMDTYRIRVLDTVQRESGRSGYWSRKRDEHGNGPVVSPDKRYTAFIKNSNVYLKDNETQKETKLSYD